MPNWCSNVLEVHGKEEDVKRFIRLAKGRGCSYNPSPYGLGEDWGAFDDIRLKAMFSCAPTESWDDHESPLCFHSLYPVPDSVRRFPFDDHSAVKIGEKLGIEVKYGGYSWQTNNWGTKWNACEARVDFHGKDHVCYIFDTAWSPPISFFDKVSDDFPELTFNLKYTERGMGFEGEASWSGGIMIHDECWDCPDDEDY